LREAIKIPEQDCNYENTIKLTHWMVDGGWSDYPLHPNTFRKIVFLGTCVKDGDLFACYWDQGEINFFKGFLNSGKY
jgi:hypothetical protein